MLFTDDVIGEFEYSEESLIILENWEFTEYSEESLIILENWEFTEDSFL